MVSWSAATLSGESLYKLGDVTRPKAPSSGFSADDECAAPLADTYGVRGRWRDLTATCQLAAVASDATIHWRTEIADVAYHGNAREAPLTLTLRHAAQVGDGADSYSNQEGLSTNTEDSRVAASRKAAEEAAWRDARVSSLEVDLLVGCDGRYSAVRSATADAADELVSYGPPYVSDFRLVAPISETDVSSFFSGGDAMDLRRIYNVPSAANVSAIIDAETLVRPENAAFATHCAGGLARVGVMTIAPSRLDAWGATAVTRAPEDAPPLYVGFFGNFRMPEGTNEPIPPIAKTAAGLRAMYMPAGGEADLDDFGRFVLRMLTENADQVHWTRMQSTNQTVLPGVHMGELMDAAPTPSAAAHLGGRVLLLGDAAGAMYPALGQGANQAIEDACAAAHVLGAACTRAAASAEEVDVPSAVDAIWALRQPRREFVSDFSKQHAAHIARPDGAASLLAEVADWTGVAGGRYDALPGHGVGSWRKGLRQLWSGWQRPHECVGAFVRARQRRLASSKGVAAAGATAGSRLPPATTGSATLCHAPQQQQRRGLAIASSSSLVKMATTATRDNFGAFGDLVTTAPDGQNWAADTDAELAGYDGSQGFPRLYLMQLDGPRPYRYDRLTHHARVTQCLGAASATDDFYLAVHAPTLGTDGVAAAPNPAAVQVFRIAPHTFVKLHRGTWHAGPIWGNDPVRVFYNLELHDTNEIDHHTVILEDTFTFGPCAD